MIGYIELIALLKYFKEMKFDYNLSIDCESKLRILNEVINYKNKGVSKESDWLELVSSLVFVMENNKNKSSSSDDEIIERLLQLKPKFTKQQVDSAYECIKGYGN